MQPIAFQAPSVDHGKEQRRAGYFARDPAKSEPQASGMSPERELI